MSEDSSEFDSDDAEPMPDPSRFHPRFDYNSLKHVAQGQIDHANAQRHAVKLKPKAAVKVNVKARAAAADAAAAQRYHPPTPHPSAANDAAIVKDAVEAVKAISAGIKPGSHFECAQCGKGIHSETLFTRHESTSSVDTHYYASVPAANKMCGPCGNKIIVLQANRDKWKLCRF